MRAANPNVPAALIFAPVLAPIAWNVNHTGCRSAGGRRPGFHVIQDDNKTNAVRYDDLLKPGQPLVKVLHGVVAVLVAMPWLWRQ